MTFAGRVLARILLGWSFFVRSVLIRSLFVWPLAIGSLLACVAPAIIPAIAQAAGADSRSSRQAAVFFETKIRPVLVHNCYQCHSGDPAKAKGHLVLDTHDGIRKGGDSGQVIVPGHADTSLLIEAIRHEGLEMPPKGMLPDEVIADFVEWVAMGAPDPRVGKAANPKNKIDFAAARGYWAFKPPRAVAPPQLSDTAWPRTDIDRFVRARQEKEKLKPVGDADRVTLLRRVTFDLCGLPPTPAEIDAFINDQSPRAFETVVDRLLASPHFGERWGRHWLDVARYGESTGKDRNLPYRYAWRYRDYVIDAFSQGKPYDRFIVEQLAGDLLPAKDPAARDSLMVATGFLAIGPKGINSKPEQFRMDQIDDQIDVTSRAFLGMTVACARCHDHKFDPIPTTDYYALAGIFHSTRTYSGIAPNRRTAIDTDLLALSDSARSAAASQVSPDVAKAEQARLEEIAQLDARIKQLRNPKKQAAANAANAGKNKKLGKGMVKNQFATSPVDPKASREQIKELTTKRDDLEGIPLTTRALTMGVGDAPQPGNSNLLNRGDLDSKGPEVPRGVLTILKTSQTSAIPPARSGRLEMAHWIASRDNPLTARVMVNRVWEHLFGQGLVDTVDNFGAMGNEPSHPELLDTLAVRFMDDKWSVKKLIRSIVLSRTYQLSSEHSADSYAQDPSDKWLWRMPPRRLDAEEIRDAMLTASGELDLKRPDSSPIMQLTNKPVGGAKNMPSSNNVRSVYLPILRGVVPESLQVFDMADPNLIVGKRDVTTVPTQALYLLNNPFVLRQAEHMAKRVLGQEGLDQSARIDLAYRVSLGRLPTQTEKAKVSRYLNDYRQSLEGADRKLSPQLMAWTSFCQTLFAAGEFRYVY